MNILAMAIASTFNSQRKYLRWHLKVLAFFTGVIDKIFFLRIFAKREPAKPLNDAQMCGSFLFL